MSGRDASTRTRSLAQRGGAWVAIQFVLIGALLAAGVRAPGDAAGALLLVLVAGGSAIIAAGTILIVLGIRQLDRSRTALPTPLDDAEMVEDGIYARVRHPIYLGMIVVALGWSVAMDSIEALVVSVVFAVFLDLKSRREETWLRDRFPRYAAYQRRTNRFVPKVY